ncbi:MAG: hypothetical protein J6U41_00435 [Lachnospiraceae bacterium]|nr:hypothetical protein [Lachnospiraceae bacterium]MBP5702594.1 hypothetical protein [Lachnospiraceae bacterium]MBP5761637.1 hypothetical protein [Lachnospiraceae bacterium]
MKRSTSWLIAGLVFFFAGVIIFGIASALMGFDYTQMGLYVSGGFIH